jgi:hypothetical protein
MFSMNATTSTNWFFRKLQAATALVLERRAGLLLSRRW